MASEKKRQKKEIVQSLTSICVACYTIKRAMQSGSAGCNLSSYVPSSTGRPKNMETRLKQNRHSVNAVLQNKNKKNYDDMCICYTAVVLRKDP